MMTVWRTNIALRTAIACDSAKIAFEMATALAAHVLTNVRTVRFRFILLNFCFLLGIMHSPLSTGFDDSTTRRPIEFRSEFRVCVCVLLLFSARFSMVRLSKLAWNSFSDFCFSPELPLLSVFQGWSPSLTHYLRDELGARALGCENIVWCSGGRMYRLVYWLHQSRKFTVSSFRYAISTIACRRSSFQTSQHNRHACVLS